ncbi:hypothetical protein INR49_029383 [Caranx melampygus]|nr:hypothetical protein INR49_029383 [Caranx melampygus]
MGWTPRRRERGQRRRPHNTQRRTIQLSPTARRSVAASRFLNTRESTHWDHGWTLSNDPLATSLESVANANVLCRAHLVLQVLPAHRDPWFSWRRSDPGSSSPGVQRDDQRGHREESSSSGQTNQPQPAADSSPDPGGDDLVPADRGGFPLQAQGPVVVDKKTLVELQNFQTLLLKEPPQRVGDGPVYWEIHRPHHRDLPVLR